MGTAPKAPIPMKNTLKVRTRSFVNTMWEQMRPNEHDLARVMDSLEKASRVHAAHEDP